MLGFTTTMMCTWESALPLVIIEIDAGFSWSLLIARQVLRYGLPQWRPRHDDIRVHICFFGSLATCASMAEVASM
jgi:hypothetical protein